MWGRKGIALGIGLMVAGAAQAQVTGLAAMPISDRLGKGEMEIGAVIEGTERKIDPRYYHSAYMVVGLDDWFELGTATDYQGTQSLGFKFRMWEDEAGQWAVSGGWDGVRPKEGNPFVVGSYATGNCRWHAGWMRDNDHRGMIGLDGAFNDRWSWGVDHIGGAEGATSLALFITEPKLQGWALTLAAGVPNTKGAGVTHSATLAYVVRF
jgi:hypothetical protein